MIPAVVLTFVEGLLGPSFAKFAKPAIYAAAIALLIALLGIAKCTYDRRLVANHDARQEAKVQKAVVGADRYAGQRKDVRDKTFDNGQGAIGTAVNKAVAANPDKAKQPVGPASQSYYDELRRQQKGKRK